MVKNITIGQYVPGNSHIHKLDPRIKIIITILFMVNIFLINSFIGYVFTLGFIGIIMYIAKLKFSYFDRSNKHACH
jgi:energy-coupling factor transport system permease protein